MKSFGTMVTMRRLTLGLPSNEVNSKFSVGYLDQINVLSILSPRKLDVVSPPSGERSWLRLAGLAGSNADRTADR
jgi:hypothetical protein